MPEDEELSVGSLSGVRLSLSLISSDPYVTQLHAGLESSDGLSAVGRITMSTGDLGAWLHTLADDYKGWDGTKEWESMERDARFQARHDGVRYVRLRVSLRGPYSDTHDEWAAEATLSLEPGEELRRLADAVAALDWQP